MAKESATASVKPSADANTNGAAVQGNFPLFYQTPYPLDKQRHKTSTLSDKVDYGFTRGTNSMPVNTIEFIEAAKTYPIVFTSDEQPIPVAVLGWEQENYFVTPKGQWRAGAYIPAYARQYPFIFYQPPNSDKFYLCIDEAAENFSMKGKKDAPGFYENDEPTDLTNNALEFCKSFYQHLNITRHFCADLKKHKLLQPYGSKATLNDGREMSLNGFLVIDEKAVNALSDEVFLEFRKKGWIAFIYLALASSSNWKYLVDLAAKNQ